MIYVLVPAHNEAPTVGLLLWKVRQLFTSFHREYHLIVVNDGSSDASDDVLSPYTRALPLTLINHRQRLGYARSLEALLREAIRRTDRPRRDVAVTIQADFSESPEDLLEIIKRLEGGADIVVADRRRRADTGRTERAARSLLARLVRGKLGLEGAADVVGTMRGYRLQTIERLVREAGTMPFLTQEGWAADLELLARAGRHARKIDSIVVSGARPVSARASRLRPVREAWRAFRASGALKNPAMPTPPASRTEEPDERRVGGRVEAQAEPARTGARADGRAEHGRQHQHQHAGRGARRGRADHKHQERPPKGRPAKPAASAAALPRAETVPTPTDAGRPAAAPPARPGADRPLAGPSDATSGSVASGGGHKRRRRRRGRGRGRGEGPASGPQPTPAPAPPPAA
jgi:hypothetical protein